MKFLLSFSLSIAVFGLTAQTLQLSDTINFGFSYEDSAVVRELKIINTGSYSIEIVDLDLFEVYGYEAFSVSDTSAILFPSDTVSFQVSFLPVHNIKHELLLTVKTKSGFGHKAVTLIGQGKYRKSYYNSTENKSEEALKNALKARLAQGYTQFSYSGARDNMYGSIDNVNGDVECVYTGRTATFNTRAGANSNNFNCEHTFPQGFFNSNLPMRSDIHHLFPTDVTSNSRRGNDPFGIVGGTPTWQMGGSKSDNSTFEPRDIHKGSCARAMMYFVIRYQDYANHFSGQEGTLRGWHNQFPTSLAEENRNSDIAALQNNRNPFVDYPQFEERITSFVVNSVAPEQGSFYSSDDTLKVLSDAGRYYYEFILFNDGNTDIEFDNFLLSDTSLHFHSSMPNDFELEPFESMSIKISYNSAISYNANLQFASDLNNGALINIPIVSGAFIGLNELSKTEVALFPNPNSGVFNIKSKIAVNEIQLIGLRGQVISVNKKTSSKMDFSHLTTGLYFINIVLEDGSSVTKRLLIQ